MTYQVYYVVSLLELDIFARIFITLHFLSSVIPEWFYREFGFVKHHIPDKDIRG